MKWARLLCCVDFDMKICVIHNSMRYETLNPSFGFRMKIWKYPTRSLETHLGCQRYSLGLATSPGVSGMLCIGTETSS